MMFLITSDIQDKLFGLFSYDVILQSLIAIIALVIPFLIFHLGNRSNQLKQYRHAKQEVKAFHKKYVALSYYFIETINKHINNIDEMIFQLKKRKVSDININIINFNVLNQISNLNTNEVFLNFVEWKSGDPIENTELVLELSKYFDTIKEVTDNFEKDCKYFASFLTTDTENYRNCVRQFSDRYDSILTPSHFGLYPILRKIYYIYQKWKSEDNYKDMYVSINSFINKLSTIDNYTDDEDKLFIDRIIKEANYSVRQHIRTRGKFIQFLRKRKRILKNNILNFEKSVVEISSKKVLSQKEYLHNIN